MKQSVITILALIIGIFLTITIVKWAGLDSSSSRGPRVVIAKSEIAPGAPIGDLQVDLMAWSSNEIPEASFSEKNKVVSRVARERIYAGEVIIEGKLAQIGSKAGMESMIALGKRAITVRVNDIVGVAGFALPGSYVDVLANIKDESNQTYSKVVLNRVKVLAVAQDMAGDPSKPKVVNAVTLELTPSETEKLDLARTVGSLSLVLRNELDNTVNTSSGARVNDLLKNHEVEEVQKDMPARINSLEGSERQKPKAIKSYDGKSNNVKVDEIRGLNRLQVNN